MNSSLNEMTLPNLIKRGVFSLEDYDYKTARQLFDQALSIDPELGVAYIGLAKAKARITRDDEFFEYCVEQHYRDNAILHRARQFADDEWKNFFNRVDTEVQKRETEKEIHLKKTKKIICLVVIAIALIIGIIYILPHIIFAPAEELYKSGQYKQAYERAAQISETGLGRVFFKGNIEKYAYAYLNDYIERNGKITARVSDTSTVEVWTYVFNSSDYPMVYFQNFIETDEYEFRWHAEYSSSMDRVLCDFREIKDSKEYALGGEFSKSDYINGQSIKHTYTIGSPRFSDGSELYQYCTSTVSNALSLIQLDLGISAEHLGFYAYRK